MLLKETKLYFLQIVSMKQQYSNYKCSIDRKFYIKGERLRLIH